MANFRDAGMKKSKRLLLSISFFVPVMAAAAGAYLLLRDQSDLLKYGALSFISGMLLLAAAEDMMNEAHESSADTRASSFAFLGALPCSPWFRRLSADLIPQLLDPIAATGSILSGTPEKERGIMGDCCSGACQPAAPPVDKAYRRILWTALVINSAMFLVEIIAGDAAGSVSLKADAMDFLSDAANYGISLFVLEWPLPGAPEPPW